MSNWKYFYLRQSLRQPYPCAATVDQPPSGECLMTSQQNVLTSQRMITSERCHLVSRDQTHHASERAHFVSHQEFLEYNTKQISQVYTLYIYIYTVYSPPPLLFLFIPLFFYSFKIPYRVYARTRFCQLIMKWALNYIFLKLPSKQLNPLPFLNFRIVLFFVNSVFVLLCNRTNNIKINFSYSKLHVDCGNRSVWPLKFNF